jgi:hypothetical protein
MNRTALLILLIVSVGLNGLSSYSIRQSRRLAIPLRHDSGKWSGSFSCNRGATSLQSVGHVTDSTQYQSRGYSKSREEAKRFVNKAAVSSVESFNKRLLSIASSYYEEQFTTCDVK